MSSYFIASNVYSPHLGKAAIVDAGWPGQPPLFPAQVASKQKHIPGEKLNRIYVNVRDNVYELRMSKESVLPASCSVNVLSQCPSMWAFRVEIPPSHKLLPLTKAPLRVLQVMFQVSPLHLLQNGQTKTRDLRQKQAAICSQRITEIVSYSSH